MNEKVNIIVKTIKGAKRKIIKVAIKLMIIAGIGVGITAAGLFAYVKSNINYTKSEAEKIALEHLDGQVVNSRIDFEDGILEYEFKIKDGNNRIYEVNVDSKYGAITESGYGH